MVPRQAGWEAVTLLCGDRNEHDSRAHSEEKLCWVNCGWQKKFLIKRMYIYKYSSVFELERDYVKTGVLMKSDVSSLHQSIFVKKWREDDMLPVRRQQTRN